MKSYKKFNWKYFIFSVLTALILTISIIFLPILSKFYENIITFISFLAVPTLIAACIVLKDISEIKKELSDEISIKNAMRGVHNNYEQKFYRDYREKGKIFVDNLITKINDVSVDKECKTEEYKNEFRKLMYECHTIVKEAKSVRIFVKDLHKIELEDDDSFNSKELDFNEEKLKNLENELYNFDKPLENFTKDELIEIKKLLSDFKILADTVENNIEKDIEGYYKESKEIRRIENDKRGGEFFE